MLIAVMNALTAHHLSKCKRTAHIMCNHTIGGIRYTRHRREEYGFIKGERADFEWLHG